MLDRASHALVCLWIVALWAGCGGSASTQQERSVGTMGVDSLAPALVVESGNEEGDGPDTLAYAVDTISALTISTVQPIDTLSPPTDTIKAVKSASGIDSVVTYSATDSIIYSLSDKTMYLFGKGDIKYKKLGLKAENIDVNWNTSILNAQGVPDSADTSQKGYRGLPDLVDGGETYHGSKISYNLRTKKGKINVGETEMEDGIYYGEVIKKVDTDVLFVGHGRYTTCELADPHYYFGSPAMKVIVKDKVVARPVYLYIADVPVFALPFGVFPTQSGRRSGVIAPAYGASGRGRYLTHLGYYWAMSDYTGLSIRGDGYTKGSWVLYSDFRYALRYNFTGGISGSYARTVSGERGDPSFSDEKLFNLRFNHNQEINPTTRLDVDFTFTSGTYYQNTSHNFDELLNQNIISNATLTKSWEGTPNSMTLNLRREQNLITNERSEVLPSISFSRTQSYPFRFGKKSGDAGSQTWYELIGYTYSGQFLNRRTKIAGGTGGFEKDERRGVNHALSINASPKVGYFTVSPFFNYREKWYDKSIRREFNPVDSTVTTRDVKAIKAVRFYDTGISMSTKFYGIFQPGVLGIKGIRHQVTPSITYTYQPDFSKPHFGYYGTYTDISGKQIQYSFYEKEVFGGAPAGERQALGLNVGNVFEMKTASSDTSAEDAKVQLLNLGLGISYNFAADSLKFSELGLNFRTNIGQVLNIAGNSRFNLYKFEVDPNDPRRGNRVNKFLIKEEGRLAQLTSFSISVGTRLSGEKKETKAGPATSAGDSLDQRLKSGYIGLYEEEPPDFSIPWNLDLTWNFSQSQPDPRVKFRNSNISMALGFNLTEFWKITASTSYDLINKEFAAPQITVYRDLHCWELNFYWVPTGQYRNFRLEIRVKAPQLRDVKVTKQSSVRDIF
ncbi:MAG: putative LPS assembly protein LptD [Ignavibacteria bacterium]|nr:putative LPS assembly protein LptD [Ignavibacteria bacterium]